jgi:hypothetical protein
VRMYIRVNDIMQLDRGPGSSLDDDLLTVSLKALTVDQFLAELMMPSAACEPPCVNQALRTALLAAMPTLDDVDIAAVQRGDQSHGMAIPGTSGLGCAAICHGQVDSPASGGPTGSRGGNLVGSDPAGGPVGSGPAGGRGVVPAGSRGGGLVGHSGHAPAPGKRKEK